MEYISTRNTQKTFSFKDVFLRGLAPDGGLFVPKKIPFYKPEDLEKLRNFSYKQLSSKIILEFCNEVFNKKEIDDLIDSSYKNFTTQEVVNLKKINKMNLLELFHGPTLAFKDIAMQVIGNMYEKILEKNKQNINIIVATSGDTGAAAINAIKDRKNMKIFVLHPYKKISDVQRKLMTTVSSNNVFNIALESNFDDCQTFVKQMFNDEKFSKSINMSGVNSINWSRIVVQIVYYFFSYFRVATKDEKINFSVPTGNFGDIYAGYIAKKMGLPINKLIIATNKNDILTRAANTGIYKPLKVEHTVSPSMDIQVASNFERLVFDLCAGDSRKTLELMNSLNKNGEFKLDKEKIKKMGESFCSASLSEEETKLTIKDVYNKYKIIIDPHTAVGIGAVNKLALKEKIVILSTAHPSKFSNVVFQATGKKPNLPSRLNSVLVQEERYKKFSKNLKQIQKYILEKV